MPDWLKEDQGVPIWRRKDKAGDTVMSVIPLNQLIPTHTLTGSPFAESMAGAGLWQPFIDLLNAHMSGDGEAPLSARFGRQVFTPDSQGFDRLEQTVNFLYNSFAPAAHRKLLNPSVGPGPAGGILPAAWNAVSIPDELADTLYSYDEVKTRKHDRTIIDEVIGSTMRTAAPIALTGPLSGTRRELEAARRNLNNELRVIREKAERAGFARNQHLTQKYVQEMQRRNSEFAKTWSGNLAATQRR
jgi:hypothetical protein